MRKLITLFTAIIITSTAVGGYSAKGPHNENLIQIAVLLDTSSSMSGLIDQAKTRLWKIVSEMAQAKKKGKSAVLQVALYEYGKSSLPAEEGYLRMVSPLTTDLDMISEELFKLRTNGGSEYCGWVIKEAVANLKWSSHKKSLKMIYIAGNEPFTQGKEKYVDVIRGAIKQGIVVNTIFCGNEQEGIRTKWKHGADLADGTYAHIDHNQAVANIKTPQDAKILALNKKLNATYIAYGRRGAERKARQKKQDSNAGSMSEMTAVDRSVAKASVQYKNSGWDIVDAVKDNKVKVEDMEKEELPPVLRNKSPKERKAYVAKKLKERKRIQKEIASLNKARQKHIQKEMKKRAAKGSFDDAVIKSMRNKAVEQGFSIK